MVKQLVIVVLARLLPQEPAHQSFKLGMPTWQAMEVIQP
jgi:hypothetical protein